MSGAVPVPIEIIYENNSVVDPFIFLGLPDLDPSLFVRIRILWLLFGFLSLKTVVNVPFKSNKKNNIEKTLIFLASCQPLSKKAGSGSLSKISWIHCICSFRYGTSPQLNFTFRYRVEDSREWTVQDCYPLLQLNFSAALPDSNVDTFSVSVNKTSSLLFLTHYFCT
jgi:hypothetical protein